VREFLFVPNFKCFSALRNFDRLALLFLFQQWEKKNKKELKLFPQKNRTQAIYRVIKKQKFAI